MEQIKECMRAALDEYVETPHGELGESFALKLEALDQLVDQLAADAARFAGLRLIITETNEDLRESMLDVMGEMGAPLGDVVTPEMVNDVFDRLLARCAELRAGVTNAND